MKELSSIQKRILCFVVLGIMFILMGNSNNSPEIFIQRIFKPITGDNWTFNYAGFIIIGGIYCCLYKLNEIKENTLVRTPFRRFIVTILLMNFFNSAWADCVQTYKGFYKNLNSIYLNRENTIININKNDGKIRVDGEINIKNCNNDTKEFYIKIKAPAIVKEDINKDYIIVSEKYILHPKEWKTLYINQELIENIGDKYKGYEIQGFEYVLFNNEDEVVFKGKISEYKNDDRDLYYLRK